MGLWTVLRFFDREPALARFCVVESARGEDRMVAYRAELLARIAGVIAAGGEQSLLGQSSPLVAEGIAGAVVSILKHTPRFCRSPHRLVGEPDGTCCLAVFGA